MDFTVEKKHVSQTKPAELCELITSGRHSCCLKKRSSGFTVKEAELVVCKLQQILSWSTVFVNPNWNRSPVGGDVGFSMLKFPVLCKPDAVLMEIKAEDLIETGN